MTTETSKMEKQKKKRVFKKTEQNTQELWDNYKRCIIRIIGISGGNEREKEAETIFEGIMTKNFPKISIRHKPQL